MKRVGWALSAVAAVALTAGPSWAQSVISARSGLIDLVEGAVFLQDQKIEAKYGNFPEVKEKQVLRTELGRAEVLLNPGVFLRLGENSSLRMITSRLIDTRVELAAGAAEVEAAEVEKETGVTVVIKDAAVRLLKAGIYRFDLAPARLRVYAGEATVTLDGKSMQVGAGKMMVFEGEQAGVAVKFDKDVADALSRWSRRRGEAVAMANVSAAKAMRDSGYAVHSGVWRWNPWFGLMTYIPARGSFYSPYGFRYWSPGTVGRVYYTPPAFSGGGSGWDAAAAGGYQGMGATSSGYSGTVASSNSSSTYSSPAASSNSGSTSSAASGSSSIGAGASGGGSRGR